MYAVDLSQAPLDVIIKVLKRIPLVDRFTCALVCKSWAEAAAAATRRVVDLKGRVQDVSCLKLWMEKHGHQLKVLQLHKCDKANLTALPCPQLQDLLLHGTPQRSSDIGSGVWGDIAATTTLTSVSLLHVQTAAQLAEVVSSLTALPKLRQLTWCCVRCGTDNELPSPDDLVLGVPADPELDDGVAEALQHLSSLTKLRHLGMDTPVSWASAGCPGLQELKRLTSLKLWRMGRWPPPQGMTYDMPASVSQLTALRQLQVVVATLTGLNSFKGLRSLTQLRVDDLCHLSPESPTLQLPGLQHLELKGYRQYMPISYLASCTQIRTLGLSDLVLAGPGSLQASTTLQCMTLQDCVSAVPNAAAGFAVYGERQWQQVFQNPGRLPSLTYLMMIQEKPPLQPSDIDSVVACCSRLQALYLDRVCALQTMDSFAPALARLSGLTSLRLWSLRDEECDTLAQLTGLRELTVTNLKVPLPHGMSTAGLRRLAAACSSLRSLKFIGCFDDSKVSPVVSQQMPSLAGTPPYAHAVLNKAPAGQPPDVSAQLLRLCNTT